MSATTAVIQNMQDMGLIRADGTVFGSIVSNDGSTIIEAEKKQSDLHSLWIPDNDPYFTSRIHIRFIDSLTKNLKLEVITNPSAISSMIDSVESWISFNNSYDCICGLNYTDIMGITYDFSFVAESGVGNYILPSDPKGNYPFTYNLVILQYNPRDERVMTRLKIELEKIYDDEAPAYYELENKKIVSNRICTLYDFLDMLFYVSFADTDMIDNNWVL